MDTTQLLLGLIATLVAGLIWANKHGMKTNDRLVTSLEKAVNAFSAFRDDALIERREHELVHGAMVADLRSIVAAIQKVVETQERILTEIRQLNGKN